VDDHFSIAIRLKNRTLALQLTADFRRIHKIAIVRYSDRAFIRLHQNRLSIQQRRSPAVE